ncbi:MAG: hypothetical protein IT173_03530 [Acidobacteria bacterium]|nr:hypothetical protein [Acidobacteriota bacterium]
MPDLLWTINALVDKWRAEGTRLLPPLNQESVVAALNETGRKYSADVVKLYSTTGGMADCEMDDRWWSLWPLREVFSENAGYKRSEILFADFLIHSHLYIFKFETETNSSVWIDYFNGEEPERVASSVASFFESLLHNPGSLQMFDD